MQIKVDACQNLTTVRGVCNTLIQDLLRDLVFDCYNMCRTKNDSRLETPCTSSAMQHAQPVTPKPYRHTPYHHTARRVELKSEGEKRIDEKKTLRTPSE